jgi:hypothetical protein
MRREEDDGESDAAPDAGEGEPAMTVVWGA